MAWGRLATIREEKRCPRRKGRRESNSGGRREEALQLRKAIKRKRRKKKGRVGGHGATDGADSMNCKGAE